MNVKAIIFDLDGTLVDTIMDIVDAANRMLKDNGYPLYEVSEYLEWIGNGATKLIERALPGDYDPAQLSSCVTMFKDIYRSNLHNKSSVYEGISEVLDFLNEKEIKISILSNKPHLLTLQVTDYYLSGWPFHTIFGQREGVPRKPDPAAALEIAGKMNLDSSEILFIGDSKYDMLAALAAGMMPVGVTWGYGSEKDLMDSGAKHVIHRPKELIALLSEK